MRESAAAKVSVQGGQEVLQAGAVVLCSRGETPGGADCLSVAHGHHVEQISTCKSPHAAVKEHSSG